MEDGLVQQELEFIELPKIVLILIVVEDGLVHFKSFRVMKSISVVLILIVVEDGLVRLLDLILNGRLLVLILIVVEDGLVPFTDLSL